jgi:uncharacterized protein YcfJ
MTRMKVNTPLCRLLAPVAAVIMSGSLMVGSAVAETRIETVVGTVVDTITLTSTYIRKTPTDQRNCSTEDVPIYAEGEGKSDLGSMIIGGLIGSAVGNKFSDNNGAGAAGTVAGAILGREHAKSQKNSRIVGYKQQESCTITTVMLEENVSKITGYRNHIELDGKIIKLESKSPLAVGSRVEVVRRVSYSLR